MTPSVAVLSCLRDPGDALGALAASLDRQSLPYRQFRVLLADLGSSDGTDLRLARLAARRPNVTVRTAAAEAEPIGQLRELAGRADTDYVLLLCADESLMPQALERLCALATSSGADVVIGRRVTPNRGSAALLDVEANRRGTPGPLGVDLSAAATGGVALIRTAVLVDALTTAEPGTAPALVVARVLAATTSAVILPGYACALGSRPLAGGAQVEAVLAALAEGGADEEQLTSGRTALTTPGTRSGVRVELSEPGLSWTGSTLRITVGGVVVLPDDQPIQLIPTVVLHDPKTGEEYPLVTAGSSTPTSETRRQAISAQAELTPAVGALGSQLPDGPWQLKLRLFGAHLDLMVAIPAAEPAPALLAGVPIGVAGAGGGLRFDLGANTLGLVGVLRVADARVADDGSGNLMTVDLPQLHADGDGRLEGHLLQNRFPVRGAVIARDGRAWVECFVGALGGRYPLSARFGGSGPQKTGLDMEVSNLGAISVVPHHEAEPEPDPKPKPTAQKAAPTHKQTRPAKPATGTVRQIRRAVPASLEPAVKRLSRVPAARWAYRALIKRDQTLT